MGVNGEESKENKHPGDEFGGTFQQAKEEEDMDKSARAVGGFGAAVGGNADEDAKLREKQMAADNATLKDELRNKENEIEQQAFQKKQLEEMI